MKIKMLLFYSFILYEEFNHLFKKVKHRKYSHIVAIVWCRGNLNKLSLFNRFHTQNIKSISVIVHSKTMPFSHQMSLSGFSLFSINEKMEYQRLYVYIQSNVFSSLKLIRLQLKSYFATVIVCSRAPV